MTGPARLNRQGRPWGVPRQHVNRRGIPKPQLSMADAIGKALVLDHERAMDPRRRDRGPVQAYECSWCGWWHFGTPRTRPSAVRVELGERAWWNLAAENRASPKRRLVVLARRAKRRGREAIPSRVAA